MGSRAALRGRRRIPDAERALYFRKLRDAVSYTYWNSNGYTECNGNTNAYSDGYSYTYAHTHPCSRLFALDQSVVGACSARRWNRHLYCYDYAHGWIQFASYFVH